MTIDREALHKALKRKQSLDSAEIWVNGKKLYQDELLEALLDELAAAEATAERRLALLREVFAFIEPLPLRSEQAQTLRTAIAAELAGHVTDHDHEWVFKPTKECWDHVCDEFGQEEETVQLEFKRDDVICRYPGCTARP